MQDAWRQRLQELLQSSQDKLERAARTRCPQLASEYQWDAAGDLMEAVRVHNNSFRFKVSNDGKTTTE